MTDQQPPDPDDAVKTPDQPDVEYEGDQEGTGPDVATDEVPS